MGRLLDPHALIWWLAGSGRLSEAARAAIEEPAHPKLVSAASAREIATGHRLGRLRQAERAGLVRDLPAAARGAGFEALRIADAGRAGGLPEPSRDPFDRMPIAQALAHDPALVSIEEPFDAYGVTRICQLVSRTPRSDPGTAKAPASEVRGTSR